MDSDNQNTGAANNLRVRHAELRRSIAKGGQFVTSLSAFIIALKLAEVKIDKISVVGADFSVQKPFVVVGALGLILIYLGIRYVQQAGGLMLLEQTIRQQERGASALDASPDVRRFFPFIAIFGLLGAVSTAIEFTLIVAAAYLAWPDVRQLLELMLVTSSNRTGIIVVASVAFAYAMITTAAGIAWNIAQSWKRQKS